MAAIPDRLIDTVSLCGPADVVRERLAVYRDAGVGTLGVTPTAFTAPERLQQLRCSPSSPPDARVTRRGAIQAAAARRLRRPRPRVPDDRPRPRARARAATTSRCRPGRAGGSDVEARGHRASRPRPSTSVFPSGPEPLDFYQAVAQATRDTRPADARAAPEVVVADILTLAPALAAEIAGVPRATLIPHVYPRRPARLPDLLARRAAAAHGRRPRALAPRPAPRRSGPRAGPRRAQPTPACSSACRRSITCTAASAANSRSSPPSPSSSTRAAGPRTSTSSGRSCGSRPPHDVELPARRGPARARRPVHRPGPRARGCCAPRCAASPARPCGCSPPGTAALPPRPLPVPDNARVVEWVSYSRTMPRCDVVVCHAGHGTLVRALASGCAVVACPAVGDMNENAARLDWAGAGVRIPRRFVSPAPCASPSSERSRTPRSARERESRRLGGHHDAGATAATLIERRRAPPPDAPRRIQGFSDTARQAARIGTSPPVPLASRAARAPRAER